MDTERVGALAPPQDVTKLWKSWRDIVKFVEEKDKPTEAFQNLLKSFGLQLLDIFDWKIITAYAHIVTFHTTELMLTWGISFTILL